MRVSAESFSEDDFIKLLESESVEKRQTSRLGIVIGTAVGGLAVLFTVTSLPFTLPYLRRVCLPYVPATEQQVRNVMTALKGSSGKVIDLGSGDGRLVLAAARHGFDSTGIELNPVLVFFSRFVSIRSGLHQNVKFHRSDIWTFNLKPYRNIIIFGVETMMEELGKKFQRELEEGAKIIACRYPLPSMTPVKTIGAGLDKVWIYNMNRGQS